MKGFVLSPGAQADIDDIWNYTAERWDADQADRYIRSLERAIEIVASDPGRGRACDDIRPDYRKYSVGSHLLFFRLVADGIDVVRVLHQSMDFDQHL